MARAVRSLSLAGELNKVGGKNYLAFLPFKGYTNGCSSHSSLEFSKSYY